MIITGKELTRAVLLDPATELGCDELRILTGYATSSMASQHLEELSDRKLNVKIRIAVGMTPSEGMVDVYHTGFKKLMDEYPGRFMCSYFMLKSQPCHSKVYVWLKNGVPIKAFVGSANYTRKAFSVTQQHETMCECDPKLALEHFDSFDEETVLCDWDEIEDSVNIFSWSQYNARKVKAGGGSKDRGFDHGGLETRTISLLTKDGTPGGHGTRLNWGHRKEKDGKKYSRNPNEAYLHVPADVARSKFFPEPKEHFSLITDDGITMICVIAQDGNKGIETTFSNSELGLYFRKRLGLAPGAFVTREDLDKYGRASVTFYKIDNESYFMDFGLHEEKSSDVFRIG